ncbi:50S ribosomal protein L18a [Nanoarchaeota archaeon NZ13-N]|nr:MAG: 50S ribosomal protein L18a [Nanoarchaeota archaeon NZ13-N]
MVNKKIFRVEGIIKKTVILNKAGKEGVDTKSKVIYKFGKEILGTSKEEVLERIYSFFGSIYKVKRKNIEIMKVEEINEEELKDKILKKFLKIWK